MTQRTYVVLGMHRSSTSITALGLSRILGDGSMGCDPQNTDFHEDIEFVHLNDDILAAAGGSWSEIPSRSAIQSQREKFTPRIKELVAERNSKFEFWGWKDPRTALTVDLFHPWLIAPHYITCWRSAEDIATSLQRVGHSLTYNQCYRMAREYHRRIYEFIHDTYINF